MRKPYPSDLTDEQWAVVEPLIRVHPTGRPHVHDMREILNPILYIDRSGCQWNMLPHDLPPRTTVYSHFARWRGDGTWQRIMDALRREVRKAAGRDPSPSAGGIDSQTVKGSEVGGGRGCDGGKKLTGVKRHIVVDTPGLLLVVVVSAASADDGTFVPEVLSRLTAEHRARLELIRADRKYRNNRLVEWLVETEADYWVEAVERPPGSAGFVKLPRRLVVERTIGRIGRSRRNSRDYERLAESSESMIRISSIHRMLRPLRPNTSKRLNPFNYRKTSGNIIGWPLRETSANLCKMEEHLASRRPQSQQQ